MKNVIILILLSHSLTIKGQTIEAKYKVSQDILMNFEGVGLKKIVTLESTGYLYRKMNRYIYFEKPDYLDLYPTGNVQTRISPNHIHNLQICMDTIQKLSYKDMDSMIKRHRMDIAGKGGVDFNYVQKFSADYFNWDYSGETKEIQGLVCQKASLKMRGKIEWVVWFCPDIEMQAGIFNIIGLPGLIVEAENLVLNSKYSLESYSYLKDIRDEVFWPSEFLQPFRQMPDMKQGTSGEKSKIQKQAELTTQ